MKRLTPKAKFKKWTKKLYELLEDDDLVVLTDEQLVDYVNSFLKLHETISYQTFKKWKGEGGNSRRVENQKSISEEEAQEFRIRLKGVRARQKVGLAKEMMNPENKAAYKQQWMMERKFDDMKEKPTLQLSTNNHVRIEAGSQEQAALLDQLFNGTGETIEVPFEEVEDETKKLEQ